MVAEFTIDDVNPKTDWIRLEYQTDVAERWIAIPFTVQRETDHESIGQGKWDVPPNTRQLAVRLVVRDAAGNESEVTRLPQLPRTANVSGGGLQFASGPSSPPSIVHRNGSQPASNLPSSKPPSGLAKNSSPIQVKPQSRPTTPKEAASRYSYQELDKSPKSPSSPFPSSIEKPASPTNGPSLTESSNEPLYLDTPTTSSNKLDYPVGPGRSASSQMPLNNLLEEQATAPDSNPLPIGNTSSVTAKPYYSHSKAFSLDYELDSLAGSPVASVELWGTSDGGKSWDMWGTDPDGKSPFDIKVETEGLFGFRMVIVGANGLASNRPRNGDNADAWIHVDTEQPVTMIQSLSMEGPRFWRADHRVYGQRRVLWRPTYHPCLQRIPQRSLDDDCDRSQKHRSIRMASQSESASSNLHQNRCVRRSWQRG